MITTATGIWSFNDGTQEGAGTSWTNLSNAWDGNDSTYATCDLSKFSTSKTIHATISGVTGSGTILRVYIGYIGHASDTHSVDVTFYGQYNSTDTYISNYIFEIPSSDTTTWLDITADGACPNPLEWTWDKLNNISAKLYASDHSSSTVTTYISEIKLKVIYTTDDVISGSIDYRYQSGSQTGGDIAWTNLANIWDDNDSTYGYVTLSGTDLTSNTVSSNDNTFSAPSISNYYIVGNQIKYVMHRTGDEIEATYNTGVNGISSDYEIYVDLTTTDVTYIHPTPNVNTWTDVSNTNAQIYCDIFDTANATAYLASVRGTVYYYYIAGTQYDESVSDSLSVGEAKTVTYTISPTTNDLINITDLINNNVNLVNTINDLISINETLINNVNFLNEISDLISINDTLTRYIIKHNTITDSTNLNDTLSNNVNFLNEINDLTNLNEILSNNVNFLNEITDLTNLNENINNNINITKISSDSINTNDIVSNTITVLTSINDLINLVSNYNNLANFVNVVVENVIINENNINNIIARNNVNNVIIANDAYSYTLIAAAGGADSITATDSQFNNVTIIANISGSITLTETVNTGAVEYIIDTLQLTDLTDIIVNLVNLVNDNTTLTDAQINNLTILYNIDSNTNFTTNINNIINVNVSPTDTLSIVESIDNNILITRNLASNIITAESIDNTIALSKQLTDTIFLNDSSNNLINVHITINDSVELAEIINNIINIAESVSDNIVITVTGDYRHTYTRITFESDGRVYNYIISTRPYTFISRPRRLS